jgi:membrane protein DedA with SNARE-associated domain
MLEHLIREYGYIAILVGTLLEGETIVVMAGLMAHQGYLDLRLVMACSFIGSFVVDQAIFHAGRILGRPWLMRHESLHARAARAENLLVRWQVPFIIGFRFLYGLRTVSPLVIGISPVSSRVYLALNGLGAAVWAVAIPLIGFYSGRALMAVAGGAEGIEYIVLGSFAGTAVVVWGVIHLRSWLRKKAGKVS